MCYRQKSGCRFVVFSVLMFVIFSLFAIFPVAVTANTYSGMDILLVIDDSGTMKNTDPNDLCLEAIRKFSDLFAARSDSRFGIAAYSGDILEGAVELTDDINQLKNFKTSKNGMFTDAAVGVKWAVDQFEQKSDDSRKKAIILIGDGENDYDENGVTIRTAEESNKMLENAIAIAKSKDINVYTLAINPISPEFSNYFSDISSQTGGTAYEPTNSDMVTKHMTEIYTKLTGNIGVGPGSVEVDGVYIHDIDVPDGVFEMNLQCDHNKQLDIEFISPDGTSYKEGSAGVVYYKGNTYTNIKVFDPIAGPWKVKYTSKQKQVVDPTFIFHKNLSVMLVKDQEKIETGKPVRYTATVFSENKAFTDNNQLEGITAKLVVSEINSKSKNNVNEVDMTKENGNFVVDHVIDNPGDYELYAKVSNTKNSDVIESNVLNISVVPGKNGGNGSDSEEDSLGWLAKVLIAVGILILLIILFLVYRRLTTAPGTGVIHGYVDIKIVGKQLNDETMIFPRDKFDCLQVFGKKNTLSDLITAYVRRYRINNTSELAEMTLAQFINSSLNDVTDKIFICGNKKKKTIVKIPVGYEMHVDGIDISKPRIMIFSSPERVIELRFNNQGCAYTIELTFTRDMN